MCINLSNDLITFIFNNLTFNNLLLLKKTNKELKEILKKYNKFVNILKIKASNYIKFRWMNYKINKKDYIICIIKNKNINEGSFYKLKLDNLICIYNKNNSTNLMYNKRCEKYIKKECFILNCISKKKNLEKQFICLDFHPYTKIYLRNNFPDYFNNIGTNSHNLIIFSSDIHFNKLYNNIN